jgi:aminomethyltransferase
LHGHELSEDDSALASGLGWIIKLEGREFIGSAALAAEHARGPSQVLVGFMITSAGIARQGDVVHAVSGEPIGIVTSGTKTPMFDRALGLARVAVASSAPGTPITITVRGRQLAAEVVKSPFYSRLTRARAQTAAQT